MQTCSFVNICRGFSSSANRTRRPQRVRTSGELAGFLPLTPPLSLGTADPPWGSPGPKTTGSLPGTACAGAGQMVVGGGFQSATKSQQ